MLAKQSHLAKRAATMVGSYTCARPFRRALRALMFLRIPLGRVIRDSRRWTDSGAALRSLAVLSCVLFKTPAKTGQLAKFPKANAPANSSRINGS